MSLFTEHVSPKDVLIYYMIAALAVGFFQAIYATNGARMGFFLLLWIVLLVSTMLLPRMTWKGDS